MKSFRNILAVLVILLMVACNTTTSNDESGKIKVVTTTTMLSDLVKVIGGDQVEVFGLMGPGVDPHLYKASEGDVSRLFTADMVFYNGLHLEGKMNDIFENMNKQGKKTFAVSSSLPEENLHQASDGYAQHDPHIWFDVNNWELVAKFVATTLGANDPEHANDYISNFNDYLVQLEELKAFNELTISQIPMDKRVLITAHDAFEYFGKAYNFEVVGLQGISTVSEAGAGDVRDLANFIYERKIPAVFIESSVAKRNIEALQAAVNSRGYEVKIGGELFSDALGSPGTPEGTYIGMYKHNVSIIAKALKK